MPFEARDIFKAPLTEAELRELAQRVPVEQLFSWKSPTARQQGLTPGSRSADELLRLMAAEPRLIRRPLVRAGDRVVVGADLDALRALVAAADASSSS